MNTSAKSEPSQAVHGWVTVNKPSGITSFKALGIVKRAFKSRKAGHAGTLDKPANGLLVIGLGHATKAIPFVTEATKQYSFIVNFGSSTTTDDATGEIIAVSEHRPSQEDIRAALQSFRGQIQQVPPQFSSVKVSGVRSYVYAAKGKQVELISRPLLVKRLELVKQISPHQAEFEMECGKGGYVRCIARDVGEKLGCLGHVHTLTRIKSGPFHLNDACELEQFNSFNDKDLSKVLYPLEIALEAIPEIKVTEEEANTIHNGGSILCNQPHQENGSTAWISYKDQAIGWGIIKEGKFLPKRVLSLR